LRRTAGCGGRRGGVSSDAAVRRRRIVHAAFRFCGPIDTIDIQIFRLGGLQKNSTRHREREIQSAILAAHASPETLRLFLVGDLDSIE
jgi:hypothetical protein